MKYNVELTNTKRVDRHDEDIPSLSISVIIRRPDFCDRKILNTQSTLRTIQSLSDPYS